MRYVNGCRCHLLGRFLWLRQLRERRRHYIARNTRQTAVVVTAEVAHYVTRRQVELKMCTVLLARATPMRHSTDLPLMRQLP